MMIDHINDQSFIFSPVSGVMRVKHPFVAGWQFIWTQSDHLSPAVMCFGQLRYFYTYFLETFYINII